MYIRNSYHMYDIIGRYVSPVTKFSTGVVSVKSSEILVGDILCIEKVQCTRHEGYMYRHLSNGVCVHARTRVCVFVGVGVGV